MSLTIVMSHTGQLASRIFHEGELDVDWLPSSFIEISDDLLGLVSLAERDLDICQSFQVIVHNRMENDRLVEILPHLSGRSQTILNGIHTVLPAIRAMIELLCLSER